MLDAVLDHIAVAVPDLAVAERRWVDELGGAPLPLFDWPQNPFVSKQYRYDGGARLELIAPSPRQAGGFVDRFLERFGTRIHHVTLKVDDHVAAVGQLEAAGLEVVDVARYEGVWHEAFLRPSTVGGLIVQVAWAPDDADEEMPDPPTGAATLVGVRLAHPDLEAARRLWTLLGASIEESGIGLHCTWPDSPACVEIAPGAIAGPQALLFSGTPPLRAEEGIGPAVEA